MYIVYHIGANTELNEGYVGVTKYPEKRWAQHSKGQYAIGCAIRKHNWVFAENFKVLFRGSAEECFRLERLLRPRPMGLNECAGGLGGERKGLAERWRVERVGKGNPNWGKHRSVESRQKMSESIKHYYTSNRYTEEKKLKHRHELSQSGAQAVRNTKWWTNGVQSIRAIKCPGESWHQGRAPKNSQGK